jgi:dienelactone hydrolase
MKSLLFLSALAWLVSGQPLVGSEAPPTTSSNGPVTLDTPRQFPDISSRVEWEKRANSLREQILVSCGLWPLPHRTPLNPHIFGRIQCDGYSVEKVYLETFPGFYLAGNLYRPTGKGKGPFPAILNPQGHWNKGRLTDTKDGSIPGRCISFARQGMIAFSYDMAGFNDTHFADTPTNRPFYQLHREFGTNRIDLLWSINLMGLQTWNSIRALDFLAGLPDADRKRLACTGESGGGTQTFMLGAIDDRLAVQAPVVMVSHIMQGGCLCENAPGLRVEYSNMEIAAAAAPRPQILVAASGDWTKDTLSVEGPAIEHIYRLFDAPEHLRYVRFNFGHNYNQTSREAVYSWFGHWLLREPAATMIKEQPFKVEPDAALRVFADGRLPQGALTQQEFIESLRVMHRAELEALAPANRGGLKEFQKIMYPAWRHTLQVDWPLHSAPKSVPGEAIGGSQTIQAHCTQKTFKFSTASQENPVLATCLVPETAASKALTLAVMCSDGSQSAGKDSDLVSLLLERGLAVLKVERFATDDPPEQFANFFTTYNRTKVQERVRDLLTVCAATRSLPLGKSPPARVLLVGTGRAGLWALLAAPGADGVAADCGALNTSDEDALLQPDLFCPGLLAMGGFQTPAMLVAGHPLCLYNVGEHFGSDAIKKAYAAANAARSLALHTQGTSAAALADWADSK